VGCVDDLETSVRAEHPVVFIDFQQQILFLLIVIESANDDGEVPSKIARFGKTSS